MRLQNQNTRLASVSSPLGDDVLLLYRMTGTEQLSRLFEYDLELLSDKDNIAIKELLGKSMTVKLTLAEEGSHRYINGIVTKISQLGMLGGLYYFRATVQPKTWLLSRASNCSIIQKKNIPDIIKFILDKHGVTDVKMKLQGTYKEREYCVQYRETDLNFINRLMEEEGIYYWFEHGSSSHVITLCDAMTMHEKTTGNSSVVYFPQTNEGRRKEEHIYEWNLSQEIQSGAYVLNDFDFETPSTDLKSKSSIPGSHAEANKEIYDYPGEYTKTSDGNQYAKVRMEELRARHENITARGNARQLATGSKFTLSEFPRADQNREYLIVSTQIVLQNNEYESLGISDSPEPYQCTCSVLSTEYTYRPPRLTPMPIVQGVQTAKVVGPSGDEIHTDKYGRVKVQFHWDRDGQKNENSSCWVRVAQIWAGKNWGAMHIPRIGQEVIVDFLEGNPDYPIVTGRVYNAEQMPPYELPANMTQSGIKSRSTKGGSSDNFNELRFEDKKGEEEIYLHAEKNFTRIVENDDVHKIGFDKKDPGDQKVEIYNDRVVSLEKGKDQLTVKEGNRIAEIKMGDDQLTVNQGNRKAEIKTGNDDLKIAMGNLSVKADLGSIAEEAMQAIELKVGQSSIKIEQSGITIKGMMITIEGQVKTDLKGVMTTVSGDAMLTVKGGIVMIN